ncbi:hypothetical protein [Streptomyces diacarni]|uniref:hypothetical protein n=1 Tax=Streptomyces diacarni TaxID=2800381 RepID=UPI003CCC4A34
MSADTTEVCQKHRPALFGVVYRTLGRVADAEDAEDAEGTEDAVREAWLRWSAADRAQVCEPRATTRPRHAPGRRRARAAG